MTADFEGDNPQRRVGCLGTIVTATLSLFFFVSNTGLLAWWVTRGVVQRAAATGSSWLPVVDWGLPVVALLSVGAIVLATRVGMRRLAGWSLAELAAFAD